MKTAKAYSRPMLSGRQKPTALKVTAGFLVLVGTYQAAEYAMRFHHHVPLFLGLMLAVPVLAVWVAKWQGFRGGSVWGLSFRGYGAKRLAIGLLVGLLSMGLAFAIRVWFGIETIVQVPAWQHLVTQTLLFAVGTFLPSLAEDVVTRGYLYGHFHRKLGNGLFVLVSAGIYVLNHVYAYESGGALLVYLAVLGVLLALPLVITRNLWYTVGVHWAGNIVYRLGNDVLTVETGPNTFPATWALTLALVLMLPVHYWVARKLARRD